MVQNEYTNDHEQIAFESEVGMSLLTCFKCKKVKQLEGGIYDNLKLLRKALNELCENNNIELPESLIELNNIFEG